MMPFGGAGLSFTGARVNNVSVHALHQVAFHPGADGEVSENSTDPPAGATEDVFRSDTQTRPRGRSLSSIAPPTWDAIGAQPENAVPRIEPVDVVRDP